MKILRDGISSFTGGVNLDVTDGRIASNEVRVMRNVRNLPTSDLGEKRFGSQRVHDSTVASWQKLFQWSPSGNQVVGVAGGDFYRLVGNEFVRTVVGFAQTPGMVTHRVSGAPRLYLGDGTGYWCDDGSTLSSVSGAPSMSRFETYKSRVFGFHDSKDLHFSVVDTPTDFSVSNGGGSQPVETYDSEPLTGILAVGGSLLLAKRNSVARYSGVTKTDVRLDTGVDGIASEVGIIALDTFIRAEDVGFGMTDRGPYLFSESGARAVEMKVHKAFDFDDASVWENAFAVHNRHRHEIWLFSSNAWWVLNYVNMAWSGPWDYQGFTPTCATRYEQSSGRESVLVGGVDGFARDGDINVSGRALDDVLRDGTGGHNVPLEIERAFTFGDERRIKAVSSSQNLVADLGTSGELVVSVSGDTESLRKITTKGAGVRTYDFRPWATGARIDVMLADYTSEPVSLSSLALRARAGRLV